MRKLRVLIADDHALVAEGLRKLLEPEFELLESVYDGRELVKAALRLRPDLILVDIAMPGLNGIEAARQIRQEWPAARLLFVTQQSDRHVVQAAFRAGGSGYIVKQAAAAELLKAAHEVLAGHYYVTPLVRGGIADALVNPTENPSELFGGGLTPRQREVLQLVAEGKSAKEIAALIGISVKTVEFHKAAITGELGLRTTAELTRYAMEHGIISR